MAVNIKHKFTSPKQDGPDETLVRPSNWNDDHEVTGLDAGAIPYSNATSGLTATNVQAAVDENAAAVDENAAAIEALAAPARVDVASAATTNIGAADSLDVRITGTTTITAFDTVAEGIRRNVLFASALTLTHNATSLINLTGANITTAAGDIAVFASEGSGNWRMVDYVRKDGTPLEPGVNRAAVPKAIVELTNLTGTPTITVLHNELGTLSATRTGAGDHSLEWTTSLTNPVFASTVRDNTSFSRNHGIISYSSTSVRLFTQNNAGSMVDPVGIHLIIWGAA